MLLQWHFRPGATDKLVSSYLMLKIKYESTCTLLYTPAAPI